MTRRGLFAALQEERSGDLHSEEKEIQSNYMNNPDANRELFPLETSMDLLLFSFYIKRI